MQTTWNEALEQYNLNFDVVKVPKLVDMRQFGEDFNTIPADNSYAIVRTDTMEALSGVDVKGRYELIQTQSYADIGNRVCGELGAEFVKGGLLKGGRIAYLQAKLPGTIRVKGTDDTIDKYLTFVNSFDGSTNFMLMPTALRIFCDNQMAALRADARDNGLSIRHTASADYRLAQADKAIMEIMNAYKGFEVKVNWLADQVVTNKQVDHVVRRLFNVKDEQAIEDVATRTRNNITAFRDELESGPGAKSFQGSALSLWHAATGFNKRHRSMRLAGRNEDTVRFESNLLGSGSKFEHKALNLIEKALAA